MKYYLHDTSAFLDEKITELYINFGFVEGLIMRIYDKNNILIIGFALKDVVELKKIKNIINSFLFFLK